MLCCRKSLQHKWLTDAWFSGKEQPCAHCPWVPEAGGAMCRACSGNAVPGLPWPCGQKQAGVGGGCGHLLGGGQLSSAMNEVRHMWSHGEDRSGLWGGRGDGCPCRCLLRATNPGRGMMVLLPVILRADLMHPELCPGPRHRPQNTWAHSLRSQWHGGPWPPLAVPGKGFRQA